MGRRLLLLGFWIAVANLAIFGGIRMYYRGDASVGYALNGHYFFGVAHHYTEVPRWLWQFSFDQIPVLIVTQVVGIACALVLWPPKWLGTSS